MGCKLSVSVVHPLRSPKYNAKSNAKKPVKNPAKSDDIELSVASDSDSYQTLYIDTPPDSERKYI